MRTKQSNPTKFYPYQEDKTTNVIYVPQECIPILKAEKKIQRELNKLKDYLQDPPPQIK